DGALVQRHRKAILSFIRSSVDVLIANESELASLYQTNSLQDAVRTTASSVSLGVITRGEQGSLVIGRGDAVSIPAERVRKVVDKTGSGDLYAAGF
ncbi:PfkB family carbohydrate kinase, partial [Acinetobacter baumannii]